ncbi:hypothetical protein VB735_16460, partial [Halotia wernerae UHCC 0503]|nr:hypothetical protein [Halotia wernerae UHCC 0503]
MLPACGIFKVRIIGEKAWEQGAGEAGEENNLCPMPPSPIKDAARTDDALYETLRVARFPVGV